MPRGKKTENASLATADLASFVRAKDWSVHLSEDSRVLLVREHLGVSLEMALSCVVEHWSGQDERDGPHGDTHLFARRMWLTVGSVFFAATTAVVPKSPLKVQGWVLLLVIKSARVGLSLYAAPLVLGTGAPYTLAHFTTGPADDGPKDVSHLSFPIFGRDAGVSAVGAHVALDQARLLPVGFVVVPWRGTVLTVDWTGVWSGVNFSYGDADSSSSSSSALKADPLAAPLLGKLWVTITCPVVDAASDESSAGDAESRQNHRQLSSKVRNWVVDHPLYGGVFGKTATTPLPHPHGQCDLSRVSGDVDKAVRDCHPWRIGDKELVGAADAVTSAVLKAIELVGPGHCQDGDVKWPQLWPDCRDTLLRAVPLDLEAIQIGPILADAASALVAPPESEEKISEVEEKKKDGDVESDDEMREPTVDSEPASRPVAPFVPSSSPSSTSSSKPPAAAVQHKAVATSSSSGSRDNRATKSTKSAGRHGVGPSPQQIAAMSRPRDPVTNKFIKQGVKRAADGHSAEPARRRPTIVADPQVGAASGSASSSSSSSSSTHFHASGAVGTAACLHELAALREKAAALEILVARLEQQLVTERNFLLVYATKADMPLPQLPAVGSVPEQKGRL